MALNPNAAAASIPALLARQIAAHGSETILRKKYRGIWQAITWAELGQHAQAITAGLRAIGFGVGDVACVLAETSPDWVYAELGILGAGGVSGGIHPAEESEPVARALQQAQCRVLFVENEEQLDKVLLVREHCPSLQRIVVFDMKGLRDFADPMCESLQTFIAHGDGMVAPEPAGADAALLVPHTNGWQSLTHGEVLQLVQDPALGARAGDERLALLPMCGAMERVFGLYLSLAHRIVSNYLENPDTVVENLQELQPTIQGTDLALWTLLHDRTAAAAKGATRLQRALYGWALSSGGAVGRFVVMRAVRRELGLNRLRVAYIDTALPPEIAAWTQALGIPVEQIRQDVTREASEGVRDRTLMRQEAYGT